MEKQNEFVITRTFDAPRALGFGPKGFTMRVATLDFRPGGMFHYGWDGRGRSTSSRRT
jgi:uncharacterized protein YndB with AHSA1/START domain